MKWMFLKCASLLAILAGGAGGAGLVTQVLAPGHCVRVAHRRICAARDTQTATDTITRTVTTPAVTVTVAQAPDPLSTAEQYLTRIIWAAEATDSTRSHGEIASLAVMNYVADSHIDLFMRAYDLNHGGLPPLKTADEMLGAQAGLCSNAAFVFMTLMRYFGYPVRSVSLYYDDPPGTPNGHSVAEVYYDGAWHYFDPTFGLYYTDSAGDVLDITTARAGGDVIEHKNNALLLNVIENPRDAGGSSDSWFELDPATQVILGNPS